MNRWFGVLGLVIILAAAFLIRFPGQERGLFTGLLVSESVTEYPLIVEVVPYQDRSIGIALQDNELDFGVLSQGMTARKTIKLESPGVPVRIRAWAEGGIAGMVELSRTEFLLNGPGSIEVSLKASDVGNYTGTLCISSGSAKYGWLGWITPWI